VAERKTTAKSVFSPEQKGRKTLILKVFKNTKTFEK
jgi:hypothetical protein